MEKGDSDNKMAPKENGDSLIPNNSEGNNINEDDDIDDENVLAGKICLLIFYSCVYNSNCTTYFE